MVSTSTNANVEGGMSTFVANSGNTSVRNLGSHDDLQEWVEGYALLVVIVIGVSANLFSLIIIRNKELNLVEDFSQLLQSQVKYICG